MKLELNDFVGKPCNSRTAYEFVPKAEHSLDLENVAAKLRQGEVFIEMETPYLLMLKVGGRDVSLFKSGKIIVKSTQEKQAARKVAVKVFEKINS